MGNGWATATAAGGLDFRYAVFEEFGSPDMPYERGTGIINGTDQHLLNTGFTYAPPTWKAPSTSPSPFAPPSVFDSAFFTGVAMDDLLPAAHRAR